MNAKSHSNKTSLLTSTEDPLSHGYDVIEIDIDSGTFSEMYANRVHCRFCLEEKEEMLDLTEDEFTAAEIANLFETITSIAFEVSEDYSQKVCCACVENVRLAAKIRSDLVKADNLWKLYLATCNNPVKDEFYYELNEYEIKSESSIPINETECEDLNSISEAWISAGQSIEEHPTSYTESKRTNTEAIDLTEMSNSPTNESAQTGGLYDCYSCERSIPSAMMLTIHEMNCVGYKRECCHWCSKYIGTCSKLKKHKIECHPDKPMLECDKCSHKFVHKKFMLRHWQSVHFGRRRFKCKFCGRKFKRRAEREYHEKIHTGDKSNLCDICGKGFVQPYALKLHVLAHAKHTIRHGMRKRPITIQASRDRTINHQNYILTCLLCGDNSISLGMLYNHYQTRHGEEGKSKFKELTSLLCKTCNMLFDNKADRDEHLREHLAYACEYCTKRFKNIDTLNNHMQNHDQNRPRPFKCEICKRCYTNASYLRQHIRCIHGDSSTRPFACDICDKSYVRRYELTHHIRVTHETDRPYKCSICPNAYKLRRSLRDHISIFHKSEKSFACSICQVRYKYSSQLVNHHNIEHS